MKSTGKVHQVDSVGVFTPKHTETVDLKAGEVGFIIAGIRISTARRWAIR